MFKNFVWNIVGKFSGQIVSFAISIVLTRLLTPAEFGIMGMAMVVITIASVFLDLGFSRALIQQLEVSQEQYSTVFYINIAIAITLTLLCFFLAGPLSLFYKQPLIQPVFRILSVHFLLNGLNLIPSSILYKRMQFKVITIIGLISAIISGIAGFLMAYNGFGIWSLVIQSLLSVLIVVILNFVYTRWYPAILFQIASIRSLWSFGSRMFGASFLDIVYTRVDVFIIGRLFAPATLGYYVRAQSLDTLVRNFSSGTIMSVLFPYIANNQNNRPFLVDLYHRYLHFIMFISVGISGLLFVIARPLFVLLFTEKWLFSAEIFQLMAIVGFVWPVSSLICNMIEGVGNSKAFLRLEVYKKLVFLPVYIFGFWYGIKSFMIYYIIGIFLAFFLNVLFLSKEMSITIFQQFKIILQYFIAGILSVVATLLLQHIFYNISLLFQLIIASVVFTSLYFTLNTFLNAQGLQVLFIGFEKVKSVINDKRNKNLSSSL